MEIFLGIIVFILGWGCGEYWGLGRPRKFLPPVGTILNVAAVRCNIFIAKYKGRFICFEAPMEQSVEIGLNEIVIVGAGDNERKLLSPVKT